MMRIAYTVSLLLVASCSAPSAAKINEVNQTVSPSVETNVAADLQTPKGCNGSAGIVADVIKHGYVPMMKGINNSEDAVMIYVRKEDMNMIVVSFKEDKTSCIDYVINNVSIEQPPHE